VGTLDLDEIADPGLEGSTWGTGQANNAREEVLAMASPRLFAARVDLEEMGRRMTAAMEAADMDLMDVITETRINESLLRRYLGGKTEPGARRIALIAKALKVNADWLLQNTENPEPVPDEWDGKTDRRATPPASGGAPLGAMRPARKVPPRRRSA
jgi:transcriptional regulator with XRE-family HTH domain